MNDSVIPASTETALSDLNSMRYQTLDTINQAAAQVQAGLEILYYAADGNHELQQTVTSTWQNTQNIIGLTTSYISNVTDVAIDVHEQRDEAISEIHELTTAIRARDESHPLVGTLVMEVAEDHYATGFEDGMQQAANYDDPAALLNASEDAAAALAQEIVLATSVPYDHARRVVNRLTAGKMTLDQAELLKRFVEAF